jgi:hypothetical protein
MQTMNAMNKSNFTAERGVIRTEEIDDSFPYVLVSSTLATLVSLAAVSIWSAIAYTPVIGA